MMSDALEALKQQEPDLGGLRMFTNADAKAQPLSPRRLR